MEYCLSTSPSSWPKLDKLIFCTYSCQGTLFFAQYQRLMCLHGSELKVNVFTWFWIQDKCGQKVQDQR